MEKQLCTWFLKKQAEDEFNKNIDDFEPRDMVQNT